MRYFTKPQDSVARGVVYECDHPVYSRCTLFKIGDKGLCVIQQRFDAHFKKTWWGPIDLYLTGLIFENEGFNAYFDAKAGEPVKKLYPTVTVRQIMWRLRMKPLKREIWETSFDHCPI